MSHNLFHTWVLFYLIFRTFPRVVEMELKERARSHFSVCRWFFFHLKESLAVGLTLLTSLGLRFYFDLEASASYSLWSLLFKMPKQYRKSLIRKKQLVKLETQLMCYLWTRWNLVQGSSGPIPKAMGMTSRSHHCVILWSVLKTWARYTFCGLEDKFNWRKPRQCEVHSI